MNNIYLLDCTLRDGGFVNDWKFGCGSIKSIFSRLDLAGVDAIEVGLIDERRDFDPNRSIFPDSTSVESVFRNLKKPNALVTAMIDYGTCPLDKIAPAEESHIDGIRVIFKKHVQDEALEYIRGIKEKGYRVYVNPVSITSYTDEELLSIIGKINKLDPYAVTVVDTYGLMHGKQLLHYCEIMNDNLNKGIILGYHAHNNFQLAYSNCITVMENIKERDLAIDGTLFGMGKSAGNACTELIAMYMNESLHKSYDINQLQEAIDIDIQKEYDRKSWGYKPLYYLSALRDCHPSYVSLFLDKKTLSVKSINKILEQIPKDKKLLFDKEFAESLYETFQSKEFEDSVALSELRDLFSASEILLVGPGASIVSEQDKIRNYIAQNSPLVIAINFLTDDYPIDFVFMGNAKRYSQFFNKIYNDSKKAKLICTSNIAETRENIDFTVSYKKLLSSNEVIRDNPLIMFLKLLQNLGINEVMLAGFDGFSNETEQNYYRDYIPLLYCSDKVTERNEAITQEISVMTPFLSVDTLTESRYINK